MSVTGTESVEAHGAELDLLNMKIDKITKINQTLKNELNELKRRINPEYLKFEKNYAEKLIFLAEKNLSVPSRFVEWVTVILLFFSVVNILIGFIAKNLIVRQFRTEANAIEQKLADRGKNIEEEIENSIKGIRNSFFEKLSEAHSQILKDQQNFNIVAAEFYCSQSYIKWQRGELEDATEIGERAVIYGEKGFDHEPKNPRHRVLLALYKSNLAYFYAQKNRQDKRNVAIEYAFEGLTAGFNLFSYEGKKQGLDLIDNFLFVTMKYDIGSEEHIRDWCRVYDLYYQKLRRERIIGSSEKGPYERFHSKIQNKISCGP
jgi:hypothetical protein